MGEDPAGGLNHWLYDDRAHPVTLGREQRVQLGNHRGCPRRTVFSWSGQAWRRDHPCLEEDRPVRRLEGTDAADADRTERVTVVALRYMDEQRAVLAALGGRLVRHLDRRLGRRRAVAGEEHPRQPRGRDGQQPLGQLDARLVGQAQERGVVEPVELGADGRVDRRLPVPMHGHPQRGHAVQVTAAVGVVEVAALGPLDHQWFVRRPHRVLGERVPDRAEVAVNEIPGPAARRRLML